MDPTTTTTPPPPAPPFVATPVPADDDVDRAESSYIDYEAFLHPSFSAHEFANTLITATNADPTDTMLDLATPLSRVLFDLQEIDVHMHTLTSASAGALLSYTTASRDASTAALDTVTAHLGALQAAYARLERDVAQRARAAEDVLTATERLHAVTAQLRDIGRALVLARQLEVLLAEPQEAATVRAAWSLRELRVVLPRCDDAVAIVRELKTAVIDPARGTTTKRAREGIAEFEPTSTANNTAGSGGGMEMPALGLGMGGVQEQRRIEAVRARAERGAAALWLLSEDGARGGLLASAVQQKLNACVTAALAALTRSLTALTSLDKAVLEVAARARTLVALQKLLEGVPVPDTEADTETETDPKPEPEPLLESAIPGFDPNMPLDIYDEEGNFIGEDADAPARGLLAPVLAQLDTPALATSFFRSVAAGLEPRVRDVLSRGGSNARILRGAKDRMRAALRACVDRGMGEGGGGGGGGGGEFEVAVMVGSVGALGR